MKVHELIELLKKQPQDVLVIKYNPEARDEGLGHWYIPRYLHLTGMKADKVDGKDCIRFSYSEEDDGWQDDSMAAIADGRFFMANNLNEDDFVWSREEVPDKDGNYLCICRHGKRYTVETHSFFAKVMENGFVRADSQWGFDCEHVPPHISSSYPVLLWSPKSYIPFNKQGGLKV